MCTCQWISGDFEEITKGEGLIYHQTFSFHTVKNLAMGFPTLCFDSILKLVVHQYTKMTHLIKTHKRTIIKHDLILIAIYFLSVVGLLRTSPMVISGCKI